MITATELYAPNLVERGEHFCFFCGASCTDKFAAKKFVKPTFTELDLVARPGRECVCGPCIHAMPVHPNYAMLGVGRWDKYRLRVAAVGHCEGDGMGRREWEREYYGDILNRTEACYRRWGVWKGFD